MMGLRYTKNAPVPVEEPTVGFQFGPDYRERVRRTTLFGPRMALRPCYPILLSSRGGLSMSKAG
jgi:hypothetical protein